MLNITIKSKNKKLLTFFLLFFQKNRIKGFNKQFKKKVRKQRLTILKSPHVNKKAQEHFEYRIFKKQFTIKSVTKLKYLIWLKKLNTKTFPDLKIKLKYKISNRNIKDLGLHIFNLKNFEQNKYYNFKVYNSTLDKLKINNDINKYLRIKKTILLLRMLEIHGEFVT